MKPALFLMIFAILICPAYAVDFSDPKAVMEAVYAEYSADPGQTELDQLPSMETFQTKELNTLLQNSENGIDVDPFINAQDYQLTNIIISEPQINKDKARVTVSFKNFDQPQQMEFLLVLENGAWKINDMWCLNTEYPYRLRRILEAGTWDL